MYIFMVIYFNMCIACMSLCVPHACARGSQKRALNPLELELQAIMNCLLGTKFRDPLRNPNISQFVMMKIYKPFLTAF